MYNVIFTRNMYSKNYAYLIQDFKKYKERKSTKLFLKIAIFLFVEKWQDIYLFYKGSNLYIH